MLILLTFHNEKFAEQNKRLISRSRKLVLFQDYVSYDPSRLRTEFPSFVQSHHSILSHSKGLGYWLWKPFLILETLKKYGPGTQVFYLDSGDLITCAAFRPKLLEFFKTSNICLSEWDPHQNKKWTKRDCFHYMSCDKAEYWDGPHAEAGSCGFQHSIQSMKFLQSWLQFFRDDPDVERDVDPDEK